MKESDLYLPIKAFLEQSGYTVTAEVKDCDLVAQKNDDLIAVELKAGANMQVLVQATDRQSITDSVYVAVPAPRKKSASHWRGIKRVLRQLELGLITVDLNRREPVVTVLFDPLPYQKKTLSKRRRAVIEEVAGRSGDHNIGGTTGQKRVTAYRENAILIATCLMHHDRPMTPAELRQLDTGEKTRSILASNHYGWFQRVNHGIYQLTDQGRVDLANYPSIVSHCEARLARINETD
ncbi:MAG: hypothetical protein HOC70_05880 [Gammaproteobacteria bacterium]|jgi:hypothetical protein|nr:hypothetical protein [Gammaproteobacteria bacterium]MBT4492757.1 hypothetical protein [Gammaproteobacteria bacterium]MBT7370074.1 hypothetical protein [Gammaproteobacteria bacterium]